MRLVLDTNVVVSGLIFPSSAPGRVLDLALSQHTVLQSAPTLDELFEVLRRPKFDRWTDAGARAAAFVNFSRACEIVTHLPSLQRCRDPRDDMYLELAAGGKADYLITGDQDLIVLVQVEGALIVTPSQFLTRMG